MDNKELEIIKAEKASYMRNYRKTHKEAIKKINSTYWLNRAKKSSENPQEKEVTNNQTQYEAI